MQACNRVPPETEEVAFGGDGVVVVGELKHLLPHLDCVCVCFGPIIIRFLSGQGRWVDDVRMCVDNGICEEKDGRGGGSWPGLRLTRKW